MMLTGKKPPLSAGQARKFLDKCLVSGSIAVSAHARKQMAQRRFDIFDARNVVRHGRITDIGYNEKHENHQVEVEGEDLDGYGLALELALELEKSLTVIITGFSPRHKKD